MGVSTPLSEEILSRFDGSPAKAVIWADAANPGDYARLAPVVFDHAERRDPLAIAIVHEAALDIERHVTRLLDLGAPAIAMIGGVFPQILPWLAPPLRPYLVKVAEGETDALEGAILMARRAYAALAEV
jgi:glucosamine kinase